ncbi:AsnC family transcriptional regulator [Streptosporangium sp. CA-115845]|uniref:AsnC family transcriptional regulator n=1 Tax=Streptosporangium sp. CA-115845 TaxID=3240071 RepID=UPI003D8E002C
MANSLDALDVALLQLLEEHPRIGILEPARLARVSRATVTARLNRMQAVGVITGYGRRSTSWSLDIPCRRW